MSLKQNILLLLTSYSSLRALEASGSLSTSGVVALVLHNHIVQYTARANDVLHVTQVIDEHWELQDPKALLQHAEHPLYYFAHGLAPGMIYVVCSRIHVYSRVCNYMYCVQQGKGGGA